MWEHRGKREGGGHTVEVTQGGVGIWDMGGEEEGEEKDRGTHRGLTTSEHRLRLKIKHYVIGVGV